MGLIATFAGAAAPILNLPFIRRVRRNHGLEHATIHVLSERKGWIRAAGRSDNHGFWLYGDLTTEEIEDAANEALSRMQAGQHELAVHPNCGTNLLTTGTLATAAAMLGLTGTGDRMEKRLERFPTILLMVIGTLILAPGFGMAFQKHFTTNGKPGDLSIVSIERKSTSAPFGGGKMNVHRIETIGG